MDVIAAKLGANMAKADLVANGQIGSVETQTTLIEEVTVKAGKYTYYRNSATPADILAKVAVGKTYNLYIGDVKYECVARESHYFQWYLGNHAKMDNTLDTGENFVVGYCVGNRGELDVIIPKVSVNTPVRWEFEEETVHTIDPKYLPNPADLPSDWIVALKAALESSGGNIVTFGAESAYSDAERMEMGMGNNAYKVSNYAPTLEQMKNCAVVANYEGGASLSFTEPEIEDYDYSDYYGIKFHKADGKSYNEWPQVAIRVPKQNSEYSQGVYVIYALGFEENGMWATGSTKTCIGGTITFPEL